MSHKINSNSKDIVFRLFSFLLDKTIAWTMFLKPQVLIVSVIIATSTFGQNPVTNNDSIKIKQALSIDKDSIESKDKNLVSNSPETMPQFPGGDVALFKFISKNLRYPKSAIRDKIEGRVIVHFIVNAEGNIENSEVLKSLSTDCDNEAIRITKKFPKWTPGTQNGKNVAVPITFPFNFRLN